MYRNGDKDLDLVCSGYLPKVNTISWPKCHTVAGCSLWNKYLIILYNCRVVHQVHISKMTTHSSIFYFSCILRITEKVTWHIIGLRTNNDDNTERAIIACRKLFHIIWYLQWLFHWKEHSCEMHFTPERRVLIKVVLADCTSILGYNRTKKSAAQLNWTHSIPCSSQGVWPKQGKVLQTMAPST